MVAVYEGLRNYLNKHSGTNELNESQISHSLQSDEENKATGPPTPTEIKKKFGRISTDSVMKRELSSTRLLTG